MVKVIPKEEAKEKESKVMILLFWLAIFSFIFVSGLFFVLDWQIKSADQALDQLEKELAKVGTPEQLALKNTVYDYKRKIDDIPILLEKHKKPTKVFNLLKTTVHPNVWFSSFQLITERNFLFLSGRAKDLTSLSQQIAIFEKNPQIEKVNLSSAGLAKDGGVEFKLEINLLPSALLIK
jgi:Tfp pilus assembly protein PilN